MKSSGEEIVLTFFEDSSKALVAMAETSPKQDFAGTNQQGVYKYGDSHSLNQWAFVQDFCLSNVLCFSKMMGATRLLLDTYGVNSLSCGSAARGCQRLAALHFT